MMNHLTTLLLTVTLLSQVCIADQLSWVSRVDAEAAVAVVQREIKKRNLSSEPYYMVSYCSQCDPRAIEVWEVKKAVTVAIPDTDYFQMQVFGRCVLRSRERIRGWKYQEPIDFDVVSSGEGEWFLARTDMAYLYIMSTDGSFHCLGKTLQLDCKVRVERINVGKQEFLKLPEKLDVVPTVTSVRVNATALPIKGEAIPVIAEELTASQRRFKAAFERQQERFDLNATNRTIITREIIEEFLPEAAAIVSKQQGISLEAATEWIKAEMLKKANHAEDEYVAENGYGTICRDLRTFSAAHVIRQILKSAP